MIPITPPFSQTARKGWGTRPGRLDADSHRSLQAGVEPSRLSAFVFQTALHELTRLRTYHRYLLVACVQIATYNHHRSAPSSELWSLERFQVYSVVWSRHGYLISLNIPALRFGKGRATGAQGPRIVYSLSGGGIQSGGRFCHIFLRLTNSARSILVNS